MIYHIVIVDSKSSLRFPHGNSKQSTYFILSQARFEDPISHYNFDQPPVTSILG